MAGVGFNQGMVARLVLASAAGCAQAMSMAWPDFMSIAPLTALGLHSGQPVAWVQCLALAVLATLLLGRSRRICPDWRGAAALGIVFSTTWLAINFGWTFVALHTYGGLPAIAAILATLALATALSAYFAVACACFVIVVNRRPRAAGLIFAAFWLMAEMARGTWLTGFGWGGSGYAHLAAPLAGYAPWIGVYGIGAVSAWIAMTLAQGLMTLKGGDHQWHFLAMTLVLAVGVALSHVAPAFTQTTGTLAVSLLQGNVAQDEKFQVGKGIPLALSWYGEQLQATQGDLVIAPETAIPLLQTQLPEGYWAALKHRFSTGSQAALIGMPTGSFREGYHNSVIGLRPYDVPEWRYDKQHLVPFGEFIPPFFRWFTQLMNIPLGDFSRGSNKQPPFEWRGQFLSANICYEDLFGDELVQRFGPGQVPPTILVNVSNLAWFGGTLALDQHLQIARMRALEFERPFALATNTGLTALVNHRAQVVAVLPRDVRGVLNVQIEGRTGLTPYATWASRWGMWPYWLGALGVLLITGWRPLRKRSGEGRDSEIHGADRQ